jgi:hypothetical protein
MPIILTFAEAHQRCGPDVLPQEFRDLVATCEEEPEDWARPGVAADWLDEHGEPDLAACFRWMHKRQMGPKQKDSRYWTASHLPGWVCGNDRYRSWDSYLAAVITMAAEMKAVRESMEK